MAYTFRLDAAGKPSFTDALGVEIIEFALGLDPVANVAIVMSVMLVPINNAYDLRFGIREMDLLRPWKVSAPDYSTRSVKQFIPRRHRAAVLVKVSEAACNLVAAVAPQSLTMETYYPDLTTRALAKYDAIVLKLNMVGYDVTDRFRDPDTRKDHWLLMPRL